MGHKTMDFIFIRYAYQFLVHKSIIGDATFFEYVFPWKGVQENHSLKRTNEASFSNHHQSEDDKIVFRKSKRTKTTKIFGLDFLTYLLENGS